MDYYSKKFFGNKAVEFDSNPMGETSMRELQHLKVDNNFIWSLWKRLQVAKPDVTAAVTFAIHREKEKAEIKDRKVLTILKLKDERIIDLETTVSAQAEELSSVVARKTDIENNLERHVTENTGLKEKISYLEHQLASLSKQDNSKDECNRKFIEKLEADKTELHRRMNEVLTELKSEKLHNEREAERAANLQKVVSTLENDISRKVDGFQGVISELDSSRKQVAELERLVNRAESEIEAKNGELEVVRGELSELWRAHRELTDHTTQQADLIHQLHGLQQHAHTVMKGQEDAFNQESSSLQQMYNELNKRYNHTKKIEAEMAENVKDLRKRLEEKNSIVNDLRTDLARHEQWARCKPSLDDAATSQNDKKDRLQDSRSADFMDSLEPIEDFYWSVLGEANHSTPNEGKSHRNEALHPIKFNVPQKRSRSCSSARSKWVNHIRSKSLGTHKSNQRTRSLSPRKRSDGDRDIKRSCSELDETRALLALKTEELDMLKVAHTKRLERLKVLQNNYNSIRQQLKTYEDAEPPSVRRKKDKPARAQPHELRNERSDGVWNELARYKKDNAQLQAQRMNLQEEVDLLRVQTSRDKATIHELGLTVDAYKDDLEKHLKVYELDKKNFAQQSQEIKSITHQNDVLSSSIERMKRDMDDITNERETLEIDKRSLKVEVMSAHQEVSEYRIMVADLKRDVKKLEQQIEEGKRLLAEADKIATSTPRSTASSLSESVRRTRRCTVRKSTGQCDVTDDEGWEDIAPPCTAADSSGSTTSGDTLGRHIVAVSRNAMFKKRHTSRNVASKRRIARKGVARRVAAASTVTRSVRDSATNTDTDRPAACTPITDQNNVGTSPSPVYTQRKLRTTTNGATSQYQRQLKVSRQRLDHAQKQLKIIKDNRNHTRRCNTELKASNEQLKMELASVMQRHKACRQTIQKLTGEVESLRTRCSDAQTQLTEQTTANKAAQLNESGNSSIVEQRLEQDLKQMTLKIKASSAEISKQAIAIRTLKAENDGLLKDLKTTNEKCGRLERDVHQKKMLLDEQRSRLTQSQQTAHVDSATISDLTTRVKLKTDAVDRLKTQLDSMKQRLSVVTKEKKDSDDRCYSCEKNLEEKVNALSKSERKVNELQSVLAELEETAKEQMHSLANHTEEVIQSLKQQLLTTEARLAAHEKFIKVLTMEVLYKVKKARLKSEQSRKSEGLDESLVKAQNIAKDILNISQSELDDIMAVDSEKDIRESNEQRIDRKWSKKCEKLLQKENFASPLVELIFEKLEECSTNVPQMARS